MPEGFQQHGAGRAASCSSLHPPAAAGRLRARRETQDLFQVSYTLEVFLKPPIRIGKRTFPLQCCRSGLLLEIHGLGSQEP